MATIHLHVALDVDAAASGWAGRKYIPGLSDARVAFHPAQWDGNGMEDGDVALDIRAGEKGIKGETDADGTVHSCFALVVQRYAPPEDQTILAPIVQYVDAQDMTGNGVEALAGGTGGQERLALAATSLDAVLRALQEVFPGDDATVFARMSEIFDGFLLRGHARVQATRDATAAERIGKVAISRNPADGRLATRALYKQGALVVVFADGNNLGLTCPNGFRVRMDHPDIRAVVRAAGEEDEWFAHTAGWLYCRGSEKSPAATPSRVDPRDLARVASNLVNAPRRR